MKKLSGLISSLPFHNRNRTADYLASTQCLLSEDGSIARRSQYYQIFLQDAEYLFVMLGTFRVCMVEPVYSASTYNGSL